MYHEHDHSNDVNPSAPLAWAHAWAEKYGMKRADTAATYSPDTENKLLDLLCCSTAQKRVTTWVPRGTPGTDDQ